MAKQEPYNSKFTGQEIDERLEKAGTAVQADLSNISDAGKDKLNEVAMTGEVGQKLGDLSSEIVEEVRQSDTLGNVDAHSLNLHRPITFCNEPLVLYGAGVPSASLIPANWDEETMGRWVGMPSFVGQMYINTSASSNVLWIAVNNTATSGWKQA